MRFFFSTKNSRKLYFRDKITSKLEWRQEIITYLARLFAEIWSRQGWYDVYEEILRYRPSCRNRALSRKSARIRRKLARSLPEVQGGCEDPRGEEGGYVPSSSNGNARRRRRRERCARVCERDSTRERASEKREAKMVRRS